ncbi:MAG: cytochrome c, partial [Bacteroidia bacterium]|nr:cytochrome c [Bacteroidia bacterium]
MAIFSFLFLSFIFSSNSISAADAAKIFKQNCAVCHSLGTNKLTGPGLAGVASRVPSDDWLKSWIKNSSAMIKSGDAYATKIYNENGQAQMSAFEFLSDEELTSLIDYIKNPPAEPTKDNKTPTGDGVAAPTEQGMNPLGILIGVIAFLIIIIAVLRGVRFSLKNLQNE